MIFSQSKSVALAMVHVKDDHAVDFHVLKRKFNMDQYSFIKVCLHAQIVVSLRLPLD